MHTEPICITSDDVRFDAHDWSRVIDDELYQWCANCGQMRIAVNDEELKSA